MRLSGTRHEGVAQRVLGLAEVQCAAQRSLAAVQLPPRAQQDQLLLLLLMLSALEALACSAAARSQQPPSYVHTPVPTEQ